MSRWRWGQIDRSRIQEGQAGGFIATEWGLPERGGRMDGQTDNMNGRCCRGSAQHQWLGGRWRGRKSYSKQNQQIRVTADAVRHTYTRLSVPLSSFSLGSLFPPGSTQTHACEYTYADRQAHLNFLLQGHAVKEDKVVSMFCSSYLCWRRHVAWAPC